MFKLWSYGTGNHAIGLLPVFLRVQVVPRNNENQTGGIAACFVLLVMCHAHRLRNQAEPLPLHDNLLPYAFGRVLA